MVTQDTLLLHCLIKENILYGRPDASDEEVYAATKQAHAHEFIETLTDPFGNIVIMFAKSEALSLWSTSTCGYLTRCT